MPAKKKITRKRSVKTSSPARARKITDKDVENYFKDKFKSCCDDKSKKNNSCKTHGGCSSAIYGLGLIGSLVYYIMTATGFWNGVWGVIKAFLWPGFLVFQLMKFLGM